ncbi:hypothetical protein N7520_011549 [Penicillium odoratum]|uniref:uncharacterized protein n=1 Tax=Penicillium odoratum TaxID=1167516 RepID=UPI0025489245|nr:uncharacterized protein N7520_011549 [Penicillium odoratum]KAJ5746367.1 hypothetical protein N7520_011549 [Penicillium odoratum]
MSVGFGFSVGDFIAALQLMGTVIDALRESSEANSSIRSVINELYALESALLHVKRLDTGINQISLTALREAASQCQLTITEFYRKIQKYQVHLQQGGTNSSINDTWMKIKWTICKKDDVDKFRAEIRAHTSTIQILLFTVQMEMMTAQTQTHIVQREGLASRIQDFSCKVMGQLSTITRDLAESIQQGKALIDSSAQVVQINLRIFQIVHDIHLAILKIPGQIQRQQPIYLTDPLNRESPFHLEFVRSPEALLAVLKSNLRSSGCGPAMIDRGEFAIEELGTQNPIDLRGPWEDCFYPGQRVVMSMIFKQQQRQPSTTCPRCHTGHQELAEKDITCITCGTVFRRIKEVIENAIAPNIADYTHVREPLENTSKDLQKFRRIQVITISNTQKSRERSWKENENMTVTMKGMTIGYTEESLAGKSITIRTGDRGAVHFNITDGSTLRRKAYSQGSSYSDHTHTDNSGRQLLEDGRRAVSERDDRRFEMSVHQSRPRSSRSGGYSRRYWV